MYYYLIYISHFLQLLLYFATVIFPFKYKIIINKCKYSTIQKFFYLNNIFQLILILELSLFLIISVIKNIFTYIMKTTYICIEKSYSEC